MKMFVVLAAAATLSARIAAQETKPVPKDSVRVSIPGCSKGYVFTALHRAEDEQRSPRVPDGMHLRMSGPKTMIAEIKAHEGSRVEITGLMKKGQIQEGVGIGSGIRVSGGPSAGTLPNPGSGQMMIDVEGWRRLPGDCPSR